MVGNFTRSPRADCKSVKKRKLLDEFFHETTARSKFNYPAGFDFGSPNSRNAAHSTRLPGIFSLPHTCASVWYLRLFHARVAMCTLGVGLIEFEFSMHERRAAKFNLPPTLLFFLFLLLLLLLHGRWGSRFN